MFAVSQWVAVGPLACTQARADFEAGLDAYGMGNYEYAAREFAASAQRGEIRGEYYLGLLHEEGQGLAQDLQLAWQWYMKAAAKGDVDAAFALGRLYSKGSGVARDLPVAYRWYSRAARGGHYLGAQERDKCARLMTPQQLEQGKAPDGD
jgi:hypothetical protein